MISLNRTWRAGSYILFSALTLLFLRTPSIAFLGFVAYLFLARLVPFQKKWQYLPLIYMGINTYFGTTYIFGVQTKLMLLGMIVLVFLKDCLKDKRFDYSFLKLCPAFCCFILICVLQALYSRDNFTLINTVYNGLTIYMLMASVKDRRDILDYMDMIIIAALAIVIVGLVEFAIQDTFYYKLWAMESRYRNGILRVGSTVSDPNFMCFVLTPCLSILTYLGKERESRVSYSFLFLLFCGVIALTQSRTGLLTMLLTCAVVLYTKIYKLIQNNYLYRLFSYFILFLGICISLILIIPNLSLNMSDLSFSGRWYVVLAALEIIWKSPVFGIGFGKFITKVEPILRIKYGITSEIGFQNPMNTVLQILVDVGLIGFAFFAAIWISNIRKCLYIATTSRSNRKIVFWISVSLIIWIFICLTLDGMFEMFLWIVLTFPAMMIKEMYLNKNTERIL